MSRPSPLVLALLLSLAAHSLLLLGVPSPGPEGRKVPAWHLDVRQAGRAAVLTAPAVSARQPGSSRRPPAESRLQPVPARTSGPAPLAESTSPSPEAPSSREAVAALPAPREQPAVASIADAVPAVSPSSASSPGSDRLVLPYFQSGTADNPLPEYPGLSRMRRESGVVVLRVFVTAEGRPGEVRLAQSSGFPRLDRAAVQAVSERWRFKPARRGEAPVAEWVQVPLEFRLTVVR